MEKFICPKCGAVFIKDRHYEAIISLQELISFIEIKNMCMKCNYIEKVKNK